MNLALDTIQGNIFGGFNKDFQDFVLLAFKSRDAGRAWIAQISDDHNAFGVAASSSEAVLKFNAQFKALKAEGKQPEQFIETGWTSFSISSKGFMALNIAVADLDQFSPEFRQGMAARKAEIGDLGNSDPSKWTAPFDGGDVHAVLLVAADSEASLALRMANIRAEPLYAAGVSELGTVHGRTRMDMPAADGQVGHEHFGFKDGVSQPGIRGVNLPDDPIGNPDQGHPGQDLLWPGEFVLGYPGQDPAPEVPEHDGPNRHAGPVSNEGPVWAKDGSYLVFRRLAQNVPAFHAEVARLAATAGTSTELMGAKLVGRYASGCPLEARAFQPHPFHLSPSDPESLQPGTADSDNLNNNFEFGDDAGGAICPMASHIRKAYPRDETTSPGLKNSEPTTQTHRLLRRGIPFGGSFGAAAGGGVNDARGLVFQCYQRSIAGQFEFVQQSWVNAPDFPPNSMSGTPGEDPIIAQSASGPFEVAPGTVVPVAHFVTTTGGEYFFSPSIDALQKLGSGSI